MYKNSVQRFIGKANAPESWDNVNKIFELERGIMK